MPIKINGATSGSTTITAPATGGDESIELSTALAGKGDISTNGAWTSYTPTWTNLTVGNGTVTASYVQIGKTVFLTVRLVFGSTTAVSGDVSMSLPVNRKTDRTHMVGSIFIIDSGFAGVVGHVNPASAASTVGNITLRYNTPDTLQNYVRSTAFSATAPFTWAVNDELYVSLTYEAA